MLKHIDPLLNAELLYALQNMGHGDRLAIVDANFPARSHSNYNYVSLPGTNASQVLSSVLKHVPLDIFADTPMWVMSQDNSDEPSDSYVDFESIKKVSEEKNHRSTSLNRQDFYVMAKECQLIIGTNDMRPYACLILQKGVLFD